MNVSVIICTWNRAQLLEKTLEQFVRVTVPASLGWELIVVDNASTDATKKVVDDYAGSLPLRYVYEETPGKSNAANRGVQESRGEYLLWTDDDALVSPDWIEQSLDVFKRTDADMVYGKVEPWWEREAPRWYSEELMGRFALLNHGDEEVVCRSGEGIGFGVNYGFKRTAFELIGPFHSGLGPSQGVGFGGEDTLLFHNAHRAGLRVVYSPKIVVRHFVPRERCEKRYHRARAWGGGETQFRLLQTQFSDAPKIARIPRFAYRHLMSNIALCVGSTLRRRKGAAFDYELRIVNFLGTLYYALFRSTGR